MPLNVTAADLVMLRDVPLFQSCSRVELAQVARVLREVCLGDGDELALWGTDAMFVVLAGRLRLTVRDTVRIVGPGGSFGALSLLDGTPVRVSAVAEGEARVCTLEQRELLMLLDRFPAVARALLGGMAGIVRARGGREVEP